MHRLFSVLILLVTTNGFAADVANLYQSQIAVTSQSDAERDKVSEAVLRQVILKVVGDKKLVDATDILPILAQSKQLVQQYQYQRTNIISEDLTEPDRLQIVMSFKERSINNELIALELPIWGRSRPETLVWMAIDDEGKSSVLGADADDDVLKLLKQAAEVRGLPILLPVMDLQDQSQVRDSDLALGFSESVEQASLRYGTPVILMANAKINSNGTMRIHWHARINGESELWQSQGSKLTALQAGIDELADRLARRFSQRTVLSGEKQHLTLQISGLRDYADYVRIDSYLSDVQNVSNVQVSSLSVDKVEFRIDFNGDLDTFKRIVSINRVLIEAPYSPTDTLNYRLSP